MTEAIDIYEFLDRHGISYTRHDHPPVYTCEEADRLAPDLPGAHTKNLFLRDKKGRRHFLLVVRSDKTVNLNALGSQMEVGKLSLGSAKRLERHLGVTPGAVTLLAVINDPEKQVEVLVDRDLRDEDALRCHPLVNTATLVIPRAGIERFLEIVGHQCRFVDVPTRSDT